MNVRNLNPLYVLHISQILTTNLILKKIQGLNLFEMQCTAFACFSLTDLKVLHKHNQIPKIRTYFYNW